MMRDGQIDMFVCCFLRKLWGRMRYAPTLTDEKGVVSLSVVGRGRSDLVGTGFFEILGR